MPLHVALLEPKTPSLTGDLARRCAEADASLHLVSPAFSADDPAFRDAGPDDWEALDLWIHPVWRDFRDAMSRERCLYFTADSDRDPAGAAFRSNTVLVFGTEALGLPDRIREKYPDRVFGLPRAAKRKQSDPAAAVELTLKFAGQRTGAVPGAPSRRASRARR